MYYKKIRQVLWFILFANLLVAVLKITIGIIIKSTSLTADGYHSLTDSSSNIVGLVGISLASKPVDAEHPYGHKKFETMTGLFISAMLFFMAGNIIFKAVDKFINPAVPHITLFSLIALILTLIINIFVSIYELKMGRKLKSTILISDSMHTRSDIFISIGVLTSLLLIKFGLPSIIDPVVSLVVAVLIVFAAYKIFKDNSSILLDKIAIDTDKIKNIAESFTEVKDTHKIRSRGSDFDIHIDMHIMTEPGMSVEQSHNLIHSIENKIRMEINENIQLIAHLEPFKIQ